MSSKIEQPLYTVTALSGVWLAGQMRAQGEVVEHFGWPQIGLNPANESGRRIALYHSRHHADPFCPKSPWNAAHRCFHLPAVLPRIAAPHVPTFGDKPGSELATPVAETEATPDMPRYRVKERTMPAQRGQAGPRTRLIRQIGRRKLKRPDETVAHIGWPGEDFEPANSVAARVVAYHEAHRDHGGLLSSPWCLYRNALFLPELPKFQRRPDGTHADASQRYSEAVAGEIEGITGKRPGVPGTVPVSTPSGYTTGVNRPAASWRRPT